MHPYSIDTNLRMTLHGVMAIFSASLVGGINHWLAINSFAVSLSAFGCFGVVWFLLDQLCLPVIAKASSLPDLNGLWIAKGISNFPDKRTGKNFEYEMEVRIKQTFSKIEVFTKTETSESRSTMASLLIDKSVAKFIYSFENTPFNLSEPELERHAGLTHLNIVSKDRLEGGYFSGKHRTRHGELILERSK